MSDKQTCETCAVIDACEVRLAMTEHFHTVPGLDFGCIGHVKRHDEVWFHEYLVPCMFKRCADGGEFVEFYSGRETDGGGKGLRFQLPANVMDMLARSWMELREKRRAVRA